ncbi:hypothetical protein GCM10010360_63710 [Streptomyces nogalater]
MRTYWSATGTGACAGRPEWADLVCSVSAGGAITGSGRKGRRAAGPLCARRSVHVNDFLLSVLGAALRGARKLRDGSRPRRDDALPSSEKSGDDSECPPAV